MSNDSFNIPRKPLNWVQPKIEEKITKSYSSLDEQIDIKSRMGTPPTRKGMFNGSMPDLTLKTLPSVPLVLKAVINPALAGSGSVDTGSQRKRDPVTGKFSSAPVGGPQTTAADDQSEARHQEEAVRAKLQEQFLGKGPRRVKSAQNINKATTDMGQMQNGPPPFAQPSNSSPGQVPGMPPSAPPGQAGQVPGLGSPPGQVSGQPMSPPGMGMGGQDPNMGPNPMMNGDMPMGQTQSGMPIYDDPYHPDHGMFGSQEHGEAAQLHQQQSDAAAASGKIPSALDHQLKSKIHSELANDSMSPTERMANNKLQPTGGVAQGGSQNNLTSPDSQDPVATFLSQMNGSGDQGKPIFGSNSMGNGPKPGMMNTQTGTAQGAGTDASSWAGSTEQPQSMPQGMGTDSAPQTMPMSTEEASGLNFDDSNMQDSSGGQDPNMYGDNSSDNSGPSLMDMESGYNHEDADDTGDDSSGFGGDNTGEDQDDDGDGDADDALNTESAPTGSYGGTAVNDRAQEDQKNPFNKSFYKWFNSI